jgi:4-diphosphocytidyl-2-C-methyl-D-erythritol kinase
MQRVRVKALAKVNLSLEVLHKRPDGFHEIRTIFQTISLADTLGVEFTPTRKTLVEIDSDIPDNLVVRAAHAVLQAMRVKAHVRFQLTKRIPMGGGLGGGSSDAASVLMCLPRLAGREMPMEELMEIGAKLGSDVPFFLIGGCALGLGRGTELYPVQGPKIRAMLLVAPDVQVSTAEAYGLLGRTADYRSEANHSRDLLLSGDPARGVNDFQDAVFGKYPALRAIRNKLKRAGARVALMSGSGACLFGIFESRREALAARTAFGDVRTEIVSAVARLI